MHFFKKINDINFMKYSFYFFLLSNFVIFFSILIILFHGINFSLDFKGGLQLEFQLINFYDIDILKKDFKNLGIVNFNLYNYGSNKDFLLNILDFDLNNKDLLINSILNYFNPNNLLNVIEIRRIEYIGASVSDKLYDNGSFAIFLSMIVMMLYITFRFNFKFGICAVLALFHDIIIILGIISLMNIEFSLIVFASLLSILGYSINDTVVIFDRIRENIYKINKISSNELYGIINESINKTLSRTLMTSFTTLLVVIVLMFFGGYSLYNFSFILFLGIIIGTYSSIYIAPYCIYLFSKYTDFSMKIINIDDLP